MQIWKNWKILKILLIWINLCSFIQVTSSNFGNIFKDETFTPLSSISPAISSVNSFDTLNEHDLQLINSYNSSEVLDFIAQQINFGPRIPDTDESRLCQNWIVSKLETAANVSLHPFSIKKGANSCSGTNIVAKINEGHEKIAIFAAHYDSRAVAEKDPNEWLRSQPIDGANDGASGVAVLLELSQIVSQIVSQSKNKWNYEFWFIFFDAEDQGYSLGYNGLPNFEWCEGSTYMAEEMSQKPENYFSQNQSIDSIKSFILLDMVGGENLEFIQESHACPDLQEHLFNVGNHIGYGITFPLDRNSYSIIDDHVPFAQIGVPTVDLIIKFWDLSNGWPYHHTQGDNITHISLESLEITGKTILYFIFFTFHPSRDIFPNGFSSPTYFQQNWPTIIIFSVGIISVVIYGIITLISRKKLKFRPFPKVTQENNQNKLQNKQKSKE